MSITQFVHGQILQGDVLEKLKEIPDNSIDVEITSPPYFSLRDYGIEGQWGKESTFDEYLDKMIQCMKELKRVLKPSGSCWINMGDSYGSCRSNKDTKMVTERQEQKPIKNYEKSKLLLPHRFAIRCIDELGLICRNDIPWIKDNPMPQSIPDRFTNVWEPVFFFTKNNKPLLWRNKKTKEWRKEKPIVNYFDNATLGIDWYWNDREFCFKRTTLWRGYDYYLDLDPIREDIITQTRKIITRTHQQKTKYSEKGSKSKRLLGFRDKGRYKQDNVLDSDGRIKKTYQGFNYRWNKAKETKYGEDEENRARLVSYMNMVTGSNPLGKNPGDVFFINSGCLPEAHFATFPIELPLKILKCACPKDGIVLDPFFGAGTVGLAAEMLGLNWKGIELNEEYIKIAKDRLEPHNFSRLDDFFETNSDC